MPLRRPRVNETTGAVFLDALKGASKGAAAGAALSVATGAAVIVTAPAWVPIVGGTMAVSAATVGVWTVCGSLVGALGVGTKTLYDRSKVDSEFNETFSPGTSTTEEPSSVKGDSVAAGDD